LVSDDLQVKKLLQSYKINSYQFCRILIFAESFNKKYKIMSLQLGDTAPDFTAETTEGKINFYEFLGNNWGGIFSHPADYTPVCTTELGRTAALQKEFDKRGVKVIAVSVDPLDKHLGWREDINKTQSVNVEFPIIADEDRTVANLYGMIHPNASTTATKLAGTAVV